MTEGFVYQRYKWKIGKDVRSPDIMTRPNLRLVISGSLGPSPPSSSFLNEVHAGVCGDSAHIVHHRKNAPGPASRHASSRYTDGFRFITCCHETANVTSRELIF